MKELRTVAAPVDVRDAAEGTATISGYAAVFGVEYQVGDFTESVDPRAFNRTLKNSKDLAVLADHDPARVLGTQESGTARFAVDDHGLRYEADLDLLDPDGISAYRKVSTRKVRQSSFAFEVVSDAWEERDNAPPHRVLREVKLWEASPVLWPASSATEVDVKRAVTSYAEYRGIDAAQAQSIPEVIDLAIRGTTPDPEPGPVAADHPEPTQDSEPKRIRPIIVKGLNG